MVSEGVGLGGIWTAKLGNRCLLLGDQPGARIRNEPSRQIGGRLSIR